MELKSYTFKGGVHPPDYKEATKNLSIEKAKAPKQVFMPMQQHIGAPCEPIVKVGDLVKIGQKIGESKAFVSTPIHSSISGKVKKIQKLETPTGKATTVIIESDGKEEVHESVKPRGNIDDLSKEEILAIIKDSGITGLGGASFPTHVKLSPPPEKNVDTVIINGAECEPYLTADYRLMLERPDMIVKGLKAIMKAVNVKKGYIGIENNKPEAIKIMLEAAKGQENIEVISVKTKYPQGDEKRLINAITGREVPAGGLPMDVGVVVNNTGTTYAIANAILNGMPLVERIATITGSCIKEPKNLSIKIGTSFEDLIEECGGYKTQPGKIIMGGPMMGIAQFKTDIPTVKGTSGILILDKEEAKLPEPEPCIRCAKCVDICPVNLQPLFISKFSLKKMFDEAAEYDALSCIECGSCSYVCPSKRPLVQSIRVAKREILSKRKKS